MKKAFGFLVIVMGINMIGLYVDWYKFFWFDILLHFSGGVGVALFMSHYLRRTVSSSSRLTSILVIVSVTMFVGVMWEFSEYLADQFLGHRFIDENGLYVDFIGDLDDTIGDLLMDMLGGFTSTLFTLHLIRRGNSRQV